VHGSRREIRRRGERIALWVASGAIVYAPLAFGATTPGARFVLDFWMVATAVVLLGHRAVSNPVPLPRALVAALGVLAVVGGLFLVNPKFVFDARLDVIEPVPGAARWLPGTYDFARSWPEVVHLLSLSLFLLSLARLCAHASQRWFLLKAVAVSGFVVAVIGIYQKAAGSESMLWSQTVYAEPTFFAAFRYHGNAVAFLNLCWPAALALLLRALSRPQRHFLATTWWSNCLLFTFGAVLVNTSKFGHIAAIPAALLALYLFRRCLPRLEGRSRLNAWVVAGLVVAALAILSLFSAEIVSKKWESALTQAVSFDRRMLAYEAAWGLLVQEARLLGVGPGCFGLVFPYFTIFGGSELRGTWTFAHQDPLQVVIEWGVVGAGAIFFVFGGAIWRLVAVYRHRRFQSASAAAALLACTVVVAHAMVDFPLHIGAIQTVAAVYLAIGWAPQEAPQEALTRRKASQGGSRARREPPRA